MLQPAIVPERAPRPRLRAARRRKWPQERVDELKRLHAEEPRLSAGRIAKELGVTHNAVIGKMNRLGLKLTTPVLSVEERARREEANRQRHNERRRKQMPWRPQPAPPIQMQCEPIRVPFLATRADQCRWPLWPDPAHPRDLPPEQVSCCGLPSVDGKPYCPAHMRFAHPFWSE